MNSQAAEVTDVRNGRVTFRIEDGCTLDMTAGVPQLRHVDRARDRAELVTNDAKVLCERLKVATGERIAALEALGDRTRDTGRTKEAAQTMERRQPAMEKTRSDRGMEL